MTTLSLSNRITQFFLLCCLSGSLSNLSAANCDNPNIHLRAIPGETTKPEIKTLGASTASKVWVTGVTGVNATLGKKTVTDPNKVEVVLRASQNARGGKGKIHLQLLAGVHICNLYVYSLPRMQIDYPDQIIVGRPAKVRISNVDPEVDFFSVSVTHRSGATYTRPVNLTKINSTTYEFTQRTGDSNLSYLLNYTITELQRKKDFSINVVKDTSYPPRNFRPPVIPVSERSKEVTTRTNNARVTIKWNPVPNAHRYRVYLNTNQSNKAIIVSSNSASLQVPVGDNWWRVEAVYDPNEIGSDLPLVSSQESAPGTILVKRIVNTTKRSIKKVGKG